MPRSTSIARLAMLVALAAGASTGVPGRVSGRDPRASLPAVRIVEVRRAFDNGEHNAFTDLCRYRGRFFLAFRSCRDGHGVSPRASIIVLSSRDGQEWSQVHRFGVPRRDTRDPHFLVFRDRLFVITGTWYCGDSVPKRYDLNEHLGYAVWSGNGDDWSDPRLLEGTYGHYAWRAASFGGTAYLCARRKRGFARSAASEPAELVESAILESEDGLVWRFAGLFQDRYGDETAFLFEPDGTIIAVSRAGGGRNAQLGRSRPPYRSFEHTDLGRYIGGPLLTRWGERLVVGGRKRTEKGYRTVLSWLHDDRLHDFAELPSGGDNSYPGFVDRGSGRALVSYYSSHERDAGGRTVTAIYLAELEIAP